MQTTVTIWIPKSDLENFLEAEKHLPYMSQKDVIEDYNNTFPITIYTEKMHIDCIQLNVSLDLFIQLNLK